MVLSLNTIEVWPVVQVWFWPAQLLIGRSAAAPVGIPEMAASDWQALRGICR